MELKKQKKHWLSIQLSSFILILILSSSCSRLLPEQEKLPILGPRKVQVNEVNGKEVTDTVYHQIPDWSYLNQDSQWVNTVDLEGKIVITDFFFTSCRTICPVMKTQMLRLYEKYQEDSMIRLVSFTIDPEHDTVALLRAYAERLEVKAPQWNMLTGVKDSIYTLGQRHYMVTAYEDKNEPDGRVHSGAFILIDGKRRIRGYYDGTQEKSVNELIRAVELLKNETE